ncbi:MAG: hypothetical protein KC561_02650 [Myxococcales bacterium]|nr:hypothetical protein [Myxococcales bacterium]
MGLFLVFSGLAVLAALVFVRYRRERPFSLVNPILLESALDGDLRQRVRSARENRALSRGDRARIGREVVEAAARRARDQRAVLASVAAHTPSDSCAISREPRTEHA